MKKRILKQIERKKITAQEGFVRLYGVKAKPIRFANLRLKIKDNPHVSRLVNGLFFFPIPVRLVIRIMMRYIKENDIPQDLIEALLKDGGGTTIYVDAEDAKIAIELF